MKGLAKKLFLPLIVAGALALPKIANAQEEEFKQKGWLGLGVGTYNGNSKEMKDVYGTITRFRISGCRDFSENFRFESALSYASKSGQPYEYVYGDADLSSSSKVSMFGVELLAKYAFRGSGADFFIGGGGTMIFFKEKLEMTLYYDGESESANAEVSKNVFGPILVLGVDIPVNKNKTTVLYGELSGRSAKIPGAFGKDVDIGGYALEVGIRFNTFTEK